MENVFAGKTIYGDGWSLKSERQFNDEEKALVSRAEVVQSNYGFSVCFHMVGGGKAFIPLSNKSKLTVGESVNMDTARIITLERSGDNDLTRIEE